MKVHLNGEKNFLTIIRVWQGRLQGSKKNFPLILKINSGKNTPKGAVIPAIKYLFLRTYQLSVVTMNAHVVKGRLNIFKI